jgi:DNA repair exonuclease SbcCD ATPase subunit
MFVKNCYVKCKNSDKRIEKQQLLLNDLTREFYTVEKFQYTCDESYKNISSSQKKILELTSEQENLDFVSEEFDCNVKLLGNLKRCRENVAIQNEIRSMKNEVESLIKSEKLKLKGDIDILKDSLWSDISKSEIDESIKSSKEILNDARTLFRKVQDLQSLKIPTLKNLEELEVQFNDNQESIQKLSYDIKIFETEGIVQECPSCKSSLVSVGGIIQYSSSSNSCTTDINSLKLSLQTAKRKDVSLTKEISTLKTFLTRQDELKHDIQAIKDNYEEDTVLCSDTLEDEVTTLETYKSKNIKSEREIKKLTNILTTEDWSSSIKSLQKSIERKEKTISNIDVPDNLEGDIDELQKYISTKLVEKSKLANLEKEIISLQKSINHHQERIDKTTLKFHNEYQEIQSIDDLKDKVENAKNDMLKLTQEKDTNNKLLDLIKKWEIYTNRMNDIKSKKSEIDDLKSEEKNISLKLTAAEKMAELILNAESRAISEVISTINIHVQMFLDQFFDEPVTALLTTSKNLRRLKGGVINQVDIKLIWKENEKCKPTNFSGGELSRLILAFMLAFSEISNSPLILLDESTASLDENNTCKVFNYIKDTFPDRLVVSVAHQIIEGGAFNKIIRLDNDNIEK